VIPKSLVAAEVDLEAWRDRDGPGVTRTKVVEDLSGARCGLCLSWAQEVIDQRRSERFDALTAISPRMKERVAELILPDTQQQPLDRQVGPGIPKASERIAHGNQEAKFGPSMESASIPPSMSRKRADNDRPLSGIEGNNLERTGFVERVKGMYRRGGNQTSFDPSWRSKEELAALIGALKQDQAKIRECCLLLDDRLRSDLPHFPVFSARKSVRELRATNEAYEITIGKLESELRKVNSSLSESYQE
jgi:hypothetical protein